MRALGLSVTLALAASACATAPPASISVAPRAAEPPGPPPPTLDGKWSLAMVRDAPLGTRLAASMKIEADRAAGVTACGSWTADAPNLGMDLRFTGMQGQEQTCDGNMRAVEERYLEALKAVRTVQMRAGYLVLIDDRGRERLYFARGT